MRWVPTIALLSAVLLCAACRGGSDQTDVGGVPLDGTAALEQNLSVAPASNSSAAVLEGTLRVSGLTVLGPAHGASDHGTPEIMARIVDPEDDILIARPVQPGASYQLVAPTGASTLKAKFQVELRVAQDIDGDGTGGDRIVQSVPVTLVRGRVARLSLTLQRGTRSTGPVVPGQAPADDSLFPEEGELLLATVEQQDGAGIRSTLIGTAATGVVVLDQDGDGVLEAAGADDRGYADLDFNGWPDAAEAAYSAPGAGFKLEGTVAAVSVAGRTLTLLADSGLRSELIVDPFVSILPLQPDGSFFGALLLDQSLIGRRVQASGFSVDGQPHANLVVVLPPALK